MQRFGGLMTLLAGAAAGAYVLLPPPQDGAQRLAEVTRISAAPDRDLRGQLLPAQSIAVSTAEAAPAVAAAAQPANPSPGTWSTVVTPEGSDSAKLKSSKPGDGESRAELTRDLQRELQRVGCYGGEISGNWSPATKRAMSAFMDRVNASLPFEEPDYILLTLVQGQKSAACGVECPQGQGMDNGRCVPQSVIAKTLRKQQREDERKVAEAQKAEIQERAAEELRAGEQKRVAEEQAKKRLIADQKRIADNKAAEDARKAQQAERIATLERSEAEQKRQAAEEKSIAEARKAAAEIKQRLTTQQTASADLPWLKVTPKRDTTVASVETTRRDPLPGRMSVGAPMPGEASTQSVATIEADRAPALPGPGFTTDEALSGPAGEDSAAPVLPSLKGKKPISSAGLPGTKSGPAIRRAKSLADSEFAPKKFRPAKIARQPGPVVVTSPKPKYKYYASAKGQRRDAPLPGTARFNLMQTMGGIY